MKRSYALVVILAIMGCEDPPGKVAPPPDPPAGAQLRGVPLGESRLPTTHHRIFVANLESRLEGLETIVGGRADVAGTQHAALASLYRTRFGYRGDIADLEGALEQSDLAVQKLPSSPETLALAADVALQAHRFDRAAELIGRAIAAGAKPEAVAAVRRELDWSAGRTSVAIESIRRAASDSPTVHTLVRLAVLERDLGNMSEASAVFEKAEDVVTDTNPHTVAWLNFQRGLGLLDGGDPLGALPFLRESVRRMPEYTAAQLHLAEALGLTGGSVEAIAIYRKMAAHPAAMAALGRLTTGPEASQWTERAEAAYESLLNEHPDLAAAHAAEFYASQGQLERAAELLARNAELQPNSWSFMRWAEAELAAGRLDAAVRAAAKAMAAPERPAGLDALCKRICEDDEDRCDFY